MRGILSITNYKHPIQCLKHTIVSYKKERDQYFRYYEIVFPYEPIKMLVGQDSFEYRGLYLKTPIEYYTMIPTSPLFTY